MKPYPCEHRVVGSVEEAVGLLAEHGADAKLVAGGQSLGPMLNYHIVRPEFLIDVNQIDGLDAIHVSDAGLSLGATAREVSIEQSALVAEHAPLLREATTHIGFPSIRHRGTIGGSVAHNDPAAEYPATLLALEATVEVASPRGTRTLTAAELFADRFLETTIDPDEMIVSINVSAERSGSRFGFCEFEERAGDFATAGVATRLEFDPEGVVTAASIAAFGGLYPSRFPAAEAILVGVNPTPEALAEAAAAVGADFPAGSDVHGSAHYRGRLVEALARRALAEAATNETH